MKTFLLEETASTNDEIKRYLPMGETVVLSARRQSRGRGTKGRSFLSEEGGVYLSVLTFPHLPAKDAFLLMAHAAVAVARTAEHFSLRPEIKWCNDVLVGGRKLAGILIENQLKEGVILSSVTGIGLNVVDPLPGLENIAVSMGELLPLPPSVDEVRDCLIRNYFTPSTFDDYLSRVHFLGKEVLVTRGERQFRAVARAILPDGRLLTQEGGVQCALSAAEISLTFSW